MSFRQGTNVEFGTNAFTGNNGGNPQPLDVAYSLDPVSNKNRDFHNPMYDAVQNNSDGVGNGSSGKIKKNHFSYLCQKRIAYTPRVCYSISVICLIDFPFVSIIT